MSSLVAIVLVFYGLLIALCLTLWAVVMLRRTSSKHASQLTPEGSSAWQRINNSPDLAIDKIPGDDQWSDGKSNSVMDVLNESARTSIAETNGPNLKQKEPIQHKNASRKNDAFERFLRARRDEGDF